MELTVCKVIIIVCFLAVLVQTAVSTNFAGKCETPVDVAFLVDSSGSLGRFNYRKLKETVNKMGAYFGISPMGSHGAVISYSDNFYISTRFSSFFTLRQFQSTVNTLRYLAQRSRMDLALDAAHKHVFTLNGNTRNFFPKIAILITDGQQSRFRNQIPLAVAAQRLRDQGVAIYAIGVGRGPDQSELESMVVDNTNHVLRVKSFTTLQADSESVAEKICEQFGGRKIDVSPYPVDIGFILHSTEQLNKRKLNKLKQFIASVATTLGIEVPNSRAALLQYSDNAGPVITFSQYENLKKFFNDLYRLPYVRGKNYIGKAISEASKQIFSSDSRAATSQVAVLVTFGKATDEDQAEAAARELRAKGVKLFVVNAGSSQDMPSLRRLVSNAGFLFHANLLSNLTGQVISIHNKIVSESVPTAKEFSAVTISYKTIRVKWLPAFDPTRVISGYEVTWRVLEDHKRQHFINSPLHSSGILPVTANKYNIKKLEPFTLYKIYLTPQWQAGIRGDVAETQSRTFEDIDECLGKPCDANAECVNTKKSFKCECNEGFTGDGFNCTDIDECDGPVCDVNAVCTNTLGSFICGCKIGYSGDGFTCIDNDECEGNPCDVNAKCDNSPGSFTCTCNTGYAGDGFACKDIDECEGSPCDVNGKCSNSPGSFECKCNTGYSGDGFTCKDIDECEGSPCDVNGKCSNSPGSFECKCNTGYSGDGFTCKDIDECEGSPCDVNGKCSNSPGSFECKCNTGYSGDGFTCKDIDECEGSPCDVNGKCSNSPGSFECKCNTGYSGDGFTCKDIDECEGSPCDVNGKCSNSPGSFECKCNIGYSGDGFTCKDINECLRTPCDPNAVCDNTAGSYSCACKTGYSGSGFFCADNNECLDNRPCNKNAKCENNPGSFQCSCNVGYSGDGFNCADVNECEAKVPPCDVNAKCYNTVGSYFCQCNIGYNGNGKVCSAVNICSYPMDLSIAIDVSDSITEKSFDTQKQAVIMLARSFGLSRLGTHVSVIVYGSEAHIEIKLDDYITLEDFSNAVRNIKYKGGHTRIDQALALASSILFTPAAGAREGMPKMFIIMTDGQQTSAPNAIPLEEAVAPLRSSGVKVVSIGIGKEVDEYELMAISEARENIYYVKAFDTLYDTITEVGQSLCQKAQKDCKSHADIALLVDSSASMRGGNYLKEKALLKAIGREFDVSMYGSHVGIILYNNDAEIITGFNNKTTLKSFENTVDSLLLKGGKVRLDKALRLAASDVFTKENGMRDENLPKILFILTDGTQNRKCDEEALELAIAPLRSEGVRVVAIGVGEADERELRPLVKSPRDLFIAGDFDEVTKPVMDFIKNLCKKYDQSCTLGSQLVDINIDGCFNEHPVEVAVCDGKCSTGTRYISEQPFYENRCSCCLPIIIDASKDITLKCPDGTNKLHRISEVSACACRACGNVAAAPPVKEKADTPN